MVSILLYHCATYSQKEKFPKSHDPNGLIERTPAEMLPYSWAILILLRSLLYLNLFGVLRELAMEELVLRLKGASKYLYSYLLFIIILNSSDIEINKFMFTSVARPTVGIKRFDSCFLPMQQYHKSLLSGLQFGTCVLGTRHCVPQGTHHIQGPNTSFLLWYRHV